MKKTKDILEHYNTPDTTLVVSSYPEKGVSYSGKVCAVGGFAKNTLRELKKLRSATGKLVVLTVVTDKEEMYEEDGILIIRCFTRNKLSSYLKFVKYVSLLTRVKQVLVEFEFSSFGDTPITLFFPLFIAYMRLTGKNVVLVLHQVISSISELSGHMGISKKNPLLYVLNFGLQTIYQCLLLVSSHVVVLEEEFKLRLKNKIGAHKVFVIPHGVDTTIKKMNQIEAKKALHIDPDEYVVLYFGYLTWYKGADIFAKAFGEKQMTKNGKKIRFIMAGGESFTLKQKVHYQNYIQTLYAHAKSRIKITGFVNEKDMPKYYSAADLVVLPYRTFMSSSGPLSLALSFNKPFIVSERLSNYFKTPDMKRAFENGNLQLSDIAFRLTGPDMRKAVQHALIPKNYEKLLYFSQKIKRARSFSRLARQYDSLLNVKSTSLLPSFTFRSSFSVSK